MKLCKRGRCLVTGNGANNTKEGICLEYRANGMVAYDLAGSRNCCHPYSCFSAVGLHCHKTQNSLAGLAALFKVKR